MTSRYVCLVLAVIGLILGIAGLIVALLKGHWPKHACASQENLCTQLEKEYQSLKSKLKSLESRYSELSEKYASCIYKLRQQLYRSEHVFNIIHDLLTEVKQYALRVEDIIQEELKLNPHEYEFVTIANYSGILVADSKDVIPLGVLSQGDLVKAYARPIYLMLEIVNERYGAYYGYGTLVYHVPVRAFHVLYIYCSPECPRPVKYNLTLIITRDLSPKKIFGENGREEALLFRVLEAYDYWYSVVRPQLARTFKTTNPEELSILYAASLSDVLKAAGLKVIYAVVGLHPSITGHIINIKPISVIPVVVFKNVDIDKMHYLLVSKRSSIDFLLSNLNLLYDYNTTTFLIYLDTYSIALRDLGIIKGNEYAEFNIIYLGN